MIYHLTTCDSYTQSHTSHIFTFHKNRPFQNDITLYVKNVMNLNVQIFQDYNYKQKGMKEIRLLLIEMNEAYMAQSCMINTGYECIIFDAAKELESCKHFVTMTVNL